MGKTSSRSLLQSLTSYLQAGYAPIGNAGATLRASNGALKVVLDRGGLGYFSSGQVSA
jgi:hypothetical protein